MINDIDTSKGYSIISTEAGVQNSRKPRVTLKHEQAPLKGGSYERE